MALVGSRNIRRWLGWIGETQVEWIVSKILGAGVTLEAGGIKRVCQGRMAQYGQFWVSCRFDGLVFVHWLPGHMASSGLRGLCGSVIHLEQDFAY